MTSTTNDEPDVPANDAEDDSAPVFLGEASADVTRPSQVPEAYDPGWMRELLRSAIALLGFGLFAAVVLMVLIAVVFQHRDWDSLEGVTTALLPTVTSVVSATTAFYFATRDGRSR